MDARSKFSCLQIDDDSDDGFSSINNNGTNDKNDRQRNMGVKQSNQRGLIVHLVEKRAKPKKHSRTKVVDSVSGFVVQDADENYTSEQKYKKDLKNCMRKKISSDDDSKSVGTGSNQELSTCSSNMSVVDSFQEEVGKSTGITEGVIGNESHVLSLYKSKLAEVLEQVVNATKSAEQARADVDKYKSRYRKLVELFRDTEVSEKAKLVIDLEKAHTAQAEIAMQLVTVQKELDQTRSKLRLIENKQKSLS